MRQLGKFDSESEVRRFADYLLTQGIKTQVEEEAAGWSIWVYHEDHVARAREEYAAYLLNPQESRYLESERAAEELRKAEVRRERAAGRNVIDVRKTWQRPALAQCPITFSLIAACVAVAFATELQGWRNPVTAKLLIASPFEHWPEFREVAHGEVWRLLTPIFLHFGIFHIVFNMLWLSSLGMTIERARGSLRFVLFVVFIGVTSNLAQYATAGPTFGGMSGVVYGLFGYILMKSRYEPEAGMHLPPNTTFWMIGWLVLCAAGVIGAVANAAHVMGLGVGMTLGSLGMLRRWIRQG